MPARSGCVRDPRGPEPPRLLPCRRHFGDAAAFDEGLAEAGVFLLLLGVAPFAVNCALPARSPCVPEFPPRWVFPAVGWALPVGRALPVGCALPAGCAVLLGVPSAGRAFSACPSPRPLRGGSSAGALGPSSDRDGPSAAGAATSRRAGGDGLSTHKQISHSRAVLSLLLREEGAWDGGRKTKLGRALFFFSSVEARRLCQSCSGFLGHV